MKINEQSEPVKAIWFMQKYPFGNLLQEQVLCLVLFINPRRACAARVTVLGS